MTSRKIRRAGARRVQDEARRQSRPAVHGDTVTTSANGPIAVPLALPAHVVANAPVRAWRATDRKGPLMVLACEGCGMRRERREHAPARAFSSTRRFETDFRRAHASCAEVTGTHLPALRQQAWQLPTAMPGPMRAWTDAALSRVWEGAREFSVRSCVLLRRSDDTLVELVVPVPSPPSALPNDRLDRWVRRHLDEAIAQARGDVIAAVLGVSSVTVARDGDAHIQSVLFVASAERVVVCLPGSTARPALAYTSTPPDVAWSPYAVPSAIFDGLVSAS